MIARRIIAVVVGLAACLGQMCLPGTAANPFPQVTPTLRAACPLETDAFIASGISMADADRQAGVSKQGAHNNNFLGCQNNPNIGITLTMADCLACGSAVIDAVYP